VTEAGERAIQLRLLVSAADASLNWNLRCRVREQMTSFVARHYPQSLPRLHADWVNRP
jgi:hypothetical protein